MTEKIKVTYSPADRVFKEANPLGEKPLYHPKYYDDLNRWKQSESKLRSFPLPDEAEELAKERFPYQEVPEYLNSPYKIQVEHTRKTWVDGFHAAKEKYPFSKEQMIGFATWLGKKCSRIYDTGMETVICRVGNMYYHPLGRECSTKELFDFYLQSLSPFKEGITYTAEVEDGRITKISEA